MDDAWAYFPETGGALLPRYDGGSLPAGASIVGPAIIREPTTTIVIYPGSAATVTTLGNYVLELDSAGTTPPMAAAKLAG